MMSTPFSTCAGGCTTPQKAPGAARSDASARAPGARSGFSLIEVMVATLILLIIVMMIGDIFRQGMSSWDSGYARAEGGMIVRGVIGSIQRELSSAVDGRLYPGVWDADTYDPVQVDANEIVFICLKESTGTWPSIQREPWRISYYWSGSEMERRAQRMKFDTASAIWTTTGSEETSTIYSEDLQDERKATYSADFTFLARDLLNEASFSPRANDSQAFTDSIFWNIPYVTITVELVRQSTFSGIEVRSWGPDAEADTDDDIIAQ